MLSTIVASTNAGNAGFLNALILFGGSALGIYIIIRISQNPTLSPSSKGCLIVLIAIIFLVAILFGMCLVALSSSPL